MRTNSKYSARVHVNANKDNVKFIGTVTGNSLKELKENARSMARSWNNHLSGRLHLQDDNTGIEFYVNANN